MIRIPGRDPNGVMNALSTVRSQFEEHWNDIFKTITIDNGSEFSTLSDLETLSKHWSILPIPTHPARKDLWSAITD